MLAYDCIRPEEDINALNNGMAFIIEFPELRSKQS